MAHCSNVEVASHTKFLMLTVRLSLETVPGIGLPPVANPDLEPSA